MERKVVLVVEADPRARAPIGGWLEAQGYEVLTCPGPMPPGYRCVIGRGRRCALADAADVVVLDTWLESSDVMEGTPPDELLAAYLALDLPVVLLRRGEVGGLPPDERVRGVRWPPDREALLQAVEGLLGPAARGRRPRAGS